MPHERLKPSWTFDAERMEKLKEIAPEAFADGKVNWESLRAALGEHLEDEDGHAEHFGLFWPGKREARRFASIPSKGTLIPAPGEGIDEDKTGNIFIEGENLEVLKLLRKSYMGRIKMIYIDPPYNTGNDFVYDDDFTEPLDSYLKMSGQADEEGKPLTTNPKRDGRFHSRWLSMMYPRLRLARELLRDDGVIFVSIDDNEVHNLRAIMNEIYGEENFVVLISWQKKYSVSNNQQGVASIRDFIMVYAKSDQFQNGLLPRNEESRSRYQNQDKDPRGPWKPVDYWNVASVEDRPNLVYDIKNQFTGKIIHPDKKAWKFSKEVHLHHVADNKIWWGKDGHNSVPALKLFLSDVKDGLIPHNWWPHEEAGHTDEAKKDLDKLFDGNAPFDTPKPVRLLKRIFQVGNVKGADIILDFFAGSATTAHAVLDLNKEDGDDRKFILVQMPEPVDAKSEAGRRGYSTIAEIAKERIRRTIKMIKKELKEKKDLFTDHVPDMGFKVFNLTNSHYKQWENYHGDDPEEIESLFDEMKTPLVQRWKPDNLLTEIMLMEGFPLDSRISNLKELPKNRVHLIESESCGHRLLVCLDEKVYSETIKALDLADRDIFICLDTAVTDSDKARLADKGLIKTI